MNECVEAWKDCRLATWPDIEIDLVALRLLLALVIWGNIRGEAGDIRGCGGPGDREITKSGMVQVGWPGEHRHGLIVAWPKTFIYQGIEGGPIAYHCKADHGHFS